MKKDNALERLHRLYDNALKLYDTFGEEWLFPSASEKDRFLSLYRLHGSQDWTRLYELPAEDLVTLAYSGMEKALGIPSLDGEKNESDAREMLYRFLEVNSSLDAIDSKLIDPTVATRIVPIFLAMRCLKVGFVSFVQYREPIISLIVDARKGDKEAFVCLVKLDSTFLTTSYGQQIITEAELTQDIQFKDDLSDALLPDPNFWSLKYERNFYALLMLFQLDDFAHRSNDEWADFLSAHGFDNFADAENVRKTRARYGLRIIEKPTKARTKLKKKHRTKK